MVDRCGGAAVLRRWGSGGSEGRIVAMGDSRIHWNGDACGLKVLVVATDLVGVGRLEVCEEGVEEVEDLGRGLVGNPLKRVGSRHARPGEPASADPRIPSVHSIIEFMIEQTGANLQQAMRAVSAPAHLLSFAHPPTD